MLAGAALLFVNAPAHAQTAEPPTVEGVRFLPGRAALFAPARPLAEALGFVTEWKGGHLTVEGEKIAPKSAQALPDGSVAVELRAVPGVTVQWNAELKRAEVKRGEKSALVSDTVSVGEGISFAIRGRGKLYASFQDAREALGLDVTYSRRRDVATLDGAEMEEKATRNLPDGSVVLDLAEVPEVEATEGARFSREGRTLWLQEGKQRVAVNLSTQRMRAWQGRRLVLDTPISSGKRGNETPQGLFTAGPIKGKMLISRKYGNAEMPWAVQVRGNVLIHGSKSVPPRAASHGCVRVPLTGLNPSRRFYEWVKIGAPIQISTSWPKEWPVDQPMAQR